MGLFSSLKKIHKKVTKIHKKVHKAVGPRLKNPTNLRDMLTPTGVPVKKKKKKSVEPTPSPTPGSSNGSPISNNGSSSSGGNLASNREAPPNAVERLRRNSRPLRGRFNPVR